MILARQGAVCEAGGEVHFGSKVRELILKKASIRGPLTADGRELVASSIILATGHSARDIYSMLQAQKISLEQKAFAVGVRIEHPQALIDSLQYHMPCDAALDGLRCAEAAASQS